jgi:hypothetical protein
VIGERTRLAFSFGGPDPTRASSVASARRRADMIGVLRSEASPPNGHCFANAGARAIARRRTGRCGASPNPELLLKL